MTRAAAVVGACVALAAVGCALDDRTLTVNEAPDGVLLLSDAQGFVDGRNEAGIAGPWYVFADSLSNHAPPGPCQSVGGFSDDQCSRVLTPLQYGEPFSPTNPYNGTMCTSGVAAQILDGNPNIWGAGIGLEVNNPTQRPGPGDPYDARAHGITGISFAINSPPQHAIRVEFPFASSPEVPTPYWGAGTSSVSPLNPGLNVIKWSAVGGPYPVGTPPPFDETKLTAIQFHVVSNTNQPTPYDFCISNLTALTE